MQKIEELETTLSQFQGLQEVKFSIYAFIQLLKVWKEEEKQNLPYAPVPLHMVFSGEEKTGRTQAAELMGKIYYTLHYLSEGNLVRADAETLNQPEEAQTLAEKAVGNVLLLSHPDRLTQEGTAFLETLLNSEQNIAVIFRGTPEEIQVLFETFPELRIKFCQVCSFKDLQEEEVSVRPSEKLEIFDLDSLAEQEEQLEALEETEFPEPERPVPKNLDKTLRTGQNLKAGARLDLTKYVQDEIRIRLVWNALLLPMEMDAYVFLLHENELTGCDEDMVFFGNLTSQNGGAAIVDGAEYPEAAFRLNKIYQDIQKIAVCFSAYGDNPAFDFSKIEATAKFKNGTYTCGC